MGNIDRFDQMATRYDTPERAAVARVIADTIRTHVPEGAGWSAIDYGCGTGLVGLQLLDTFSSLLFVDASASMVEQVRLKLQERDAENAKTLYCNIMEAIPDGLRADCILVVQVLLHESDVPLLLSRLRSLLNDGGRLVIVDFDRNDAVVSREVQGGFDQAALAELLSGMSFSNIHSETFYQGEKLLMNQDASLFILTAEQGGPHAILNRCPKHTRKGRSPDGLLSESWKP
ncbi:MAG: methyltransferase domain-containing protein [Coriobacteriales bacterium]|jgi:ubiquinone/menaquinone biosynthesis C-methylase UbiE|nr:methyltransferase domain-containing protein [Coriobacteriales bacterium]